MEAKYFEDETQLDTAAADLIFSLSDKAVRESKPFRLVLSGGHSPVNLYRMLALNPYHKKISWEHIHFFWGDERMVPPDHPLSNYHTANENLFKKLLISEKHIHRIRGELKTAQKASEDYEKQLMKFFNLTAEKKPVFDLIILGLGADGHTASLFPGDRAGFENQMIIPVENPASEPYIPRVTMTLSVLNSARNVLFLVSQINKKEILDKILNHEYANPETTYPSAMIKPSGHLFWYIAGIR